MLCVWRLWVLHPILRCRMFSTQISVRWLTTLHCDPLDLTFGSFTLCPARGSNYYIVYWLSTFNSFLWTLNKVWPLNPTGSRLGHAIVWSGPNTNYPKTKPTHVHSNHFVLVGHAMSKYLVSTYKSIALPGFRVHAKKAFSQGVVYLLFLCTLQKRYCSLRTPKSGLSKVLQEPSLFRGLGESRSRSKEGNNKGSCSPSTLVHLVFPRSAAW
jgi:hypothetical protein